MIPVQIEAAELSQALATGVASAFISSGSTGYDRKVWEHLSHYYKVNAWLPRNYVMVQRKHGTACDDVTSRRSRKLLTKPAHPVLPNPKSWQISTLPSWQRTA